MPIKNIFNSLTQNIIDSTKSRNNFTNNSNYQTCKELPYNVRKEVISKNINELLSFGQKSFVQTACEIANREEWQCVLFNLTTTMLDKNIKSYYLELIYLFYFAYSYITVNSFICRCQLPTTDSNYIKLNEFNYSLDVNPVIISPNFDVLYFPAVIDLTYLRGTNKAVKIYLPSDIKTIENFYILQFIDLFSNNFAYISSKTNTNFITTWELVAPDYNMPLNSNQIKSNSWYLIILGRIEIIDLNESVILEKQFILDTDNLDSDNIKLINTYNLNINEPFNQFTMVTFYNALNNVLQWQNYFTEQDKIFLNIISKFNIIKYPPFSYIPFFKPALVGIDQYVKGSEIGQNTIKFAIINSNKQIGNDWGTSANLIGLEGPGRYLAYAVINWQYTFGNSEQEVIYFSLYYDSNSLPLNGANNYTINFSDLPPHNEPGFWTITPYEPSGYIYDNGQKNFTVGKFLTQPNIKITLSNKMPENPDDQFYLVTPPSDYYLLLRVYSTTNSTINYIPPPVIKN